MMKRDSIPIIVARTAIAIVAVCERPECDEDVLINMLESED
jgi:hypothetical protein